MISEEGARARILGRVRRLPPGQLSISGAVDCFSAEDYFARLPLPNFDNSAMDGYAVIASDSRHGAKLRVVGEQPAGADGQPRVSTGETIPIFTGAPVPGGGEGVLIPGAVTPNGDGSCVNDEAGARQVDRGAGCDPVRGP